MDCPTDSQKSTAILVGNEDNSCLKSDSSSIGSYTIRIVLVPGIAPWVKSRYSVFLSLFPNWM